MVVVNKKNYLKKKKNTKKHTVFFIDSFWPGEWTETCYLQIHLYDLGSASCILKYSSYRVVMIGWAVAQAHVWASQQMELVPRGYVQLLKAGNNSPETGETQTEGLKEPFG